MLTKKNEIIKFFQVLNGRAFTVETIIAREMNTLYEVDFDMQISDEGDRVYLFTLLATYEILLLDKGAQLTVTTRAQNVQEFYINDWRHVCVAIVSFIMTRQVRPIADPMFIFTAFEPVLNVISQIAFSNNSSKDIQKLFGDVYNYVSQYYVGLSAKERVAVS